MFRRRVEKKHIYVWASPTVERGIPILGGPLDGQRADTEVYEFTALVPSTPSVQYANMSHYLGNPEPLDYVEYRYRKMRLSKRPNLDIGEIRTEYHMVDCVPHLPERLVGDW